MSKRKLQITVAVAASFLSLIVVWMLCTPGRTVSDAARYEQWQRPLDSYSKVVFLERHLPAIVGRLLHLGKLEQKYLEKDEKTEEALLASGYLTNTYIPMTNASGRRLETAARLRKATHRSGTKWVFWVRSNSVVVITCRPQDVSVCARALGIN